MITWRNFHEEDRPSGTRIPARTGFAHTRRCDGVQYPWTIYLSWEPHRIINVRSWRPKTVSTVEALAVLSPMRHDGEVRTIASNTEGVVRLGGAVHTRNVSTDIRGKRCSICLKASLAGGNVNLQRKSKGQCVTA
jgi:hypothetical protein